MKGHICNTMRTDNPSVPRILLIENDVALSKMLCEYLESQGYWVQLAHSGYQATRLMRRRAHDLAVLDEHLPDIGGLDWLTSYRQQSSHPLIFLTGSSTDCISGLEAGADDCLSKPLCMWELKARIHALLRRRGADRPNSGLPAPRHLHRCGSYRAETYDRLSYRGSSMAESSELQNRRSRAGLLVTGPLMLNPATGMATIEGHAVSLTGAEQRILEILMRSAGCVVQRQQIGVFALGRIPSAYDRSIDTHISSLRRKLRSTALASTLVIRNLRGQGYLLAADDSGVSA